MGWGRYFFLGDFGQQLDVEDQRRAIEEMRGNQSWKDRTQDQQIAALEAEVADLRRHVGRLCQVMIDKGVLPEAEIARLATDVFEPQKR